MKLSRINEVLDLKPGSISHNRTLPPKGINLFPVPVLSEILYCCFLFVIIYPTFVMCILNSNLGSQSAQRCKNPFPVENHSS